jgi:F-type H+-transporting ATPase subunit epsilon
MCLRVKVVGRFSCLEPRGDRVYDVATMAFQCTVVTPEAQILDQQITGATVPGFDGMIGIETGRAPILLRLGAGKLTLHVSGKTDVVYFIEGGVAQMKDNKLTILTDKASSLDSLKADEARKELETLRNPGAMDEEQFATHQKKVQRANAVLRAVSQN